MNKQKSLLIICQNAKTAARSLANANSAEKNAALIKMGQALRKNKADILVANKMDVDAAKKNKLKPSFLDRLILTEQRIEAMAQGLCDIAELADPVGKPLAVFYRPNGLQITRISVPIGVIGVIYESRPNVTSDAAGLCLKSGNAVILRGGSESFHTCAEIIKVLHQALANTSLPTTCIQMLPSTDRSYVNEMLQMDDYIDVIIPRGGPQLIEHIAQQSKIPLFKHLAGLCHTYIHAAANKEMAINVLLNAKLRRPGICGATETLLIDKNIASDFLPAVLNALIAHGCEVRGDKEVQAFNQEVKLAKARDFDTEFLAPVIAVKIVEDIDAAIAHIAKHGTQHTDAIITDDGEVAEKFLQNVDSAIVMHNTSTQFADGGEFGMGAEIGIATGKLHARGPVGVEQLTTFKYLVQGSGQIRT